MTIQRIMRLAVALACIALFAHKADAQALPPAQEDAIRAIVRDYLMKNPEVIIEALQAYEAKQKQDLASTQTSTIRQRQAEIFNDPQTPASGAANADVTVVEFFDYRCQYCKQVAGTMAQLMRADPKVRIVYKELPILGPDSVVAARAALAANMQGQYHKMHTALMNRRGTLDEPTVLAIAGELGLDAARLKSDMNKPEIAATIERNRALARDLGIRGTPAFVIGEQIIPGAIDIETMRSVVARARQK
jgi:protein-disulfide isomerase